MSATGFNHSTHWVEFSPIIELRVEAHMQLTNLIAVKAGYTGIFVNNVVRAADMVDYTLPNMGITRNLERQPATGVHPRPEPQHRIQPLSKQFPGRDGRRGSRLRVCCPDCFLWALLPANGLLLLLGSLFLRRQFLRSASSASSPNSPSKRCRNGLSGRSSSKRASALVNVSSLIS